MAFNSLHRVTLFVLAVPISQELGLTLPQMGVLQSAMLIGYLAAQIPAGFLADHFGGARVITLGLAAWSLANAATPLASYSPAPLAMLVAARALLGLCQAAGQPSVSAMCARWVPSEKRARVTSLIYTGSSLGTVIGMALTPALAAVVGWQAAFNWFALAGIAWSAVFWQLLPPEGQKSNIPAATANVTSAAPSGLLSNAVPRTKSYKQRQQLQAFGKSDPPLPSRHRGSSGERSVLERTRTRTSMLSEVRKQQQDSAFSSQRQLRTREGAAQRGKQLVAEPGAGQADQRAAEQADQSEVRRPLQGRLPQVGLLCYSHAVIGCGFFVMQAWIPTYLGSLGVADIGSVGLLSALPWLATAAASAGSGALADWLQTSRGWGLVRTRRALHLLSQLGAGSALAVLALIPAPRLPLAVGCLTAALALQACCSAGFHPYIQEVAPADAGKLLGLTNCCGIAVGVLGNLATGVLAGSGAGYSWVWGITAVLYFSSAAVWQRFIWGQPLSF